MRSSQGRGRQTSLPVCSVQLHKNMQDKTDWTLTGVSVPYSRLESPWLVAVDNSENPRHARQDMDTPSLYLLRTCSAEQIALKSCLTAFGRPLWGRTSLDKPTTKLAGEFHAVRNRRGPHAFLGLPLPNLPIRNPVYRPVFDLLMLSPYPIRRVPDTCPLVSWCVYVCVFTEHTARCDVSIP